MRRDSSVYSDTFARLRYGTRQADRGEFQFDLMAHPASCRILIIDDDPSDRELYSRLLQSSSKESFEIIEASTVEDGILYAREQDPDCILLDYRLGEIDGLEALRRLSDGQPGVIPYPVVMLTGRGDEEVERDSLRSGAQDYLDKTTVDAPLLVASIRHSIERHRLFRRMAETESRVHAVLDSLPMPMCVKDSEGRFTLVNRAFLQMIGAPESEVVGRTSREIRPAEYVPIIEEGDRAAWESTGIVEGEEARPTPQGVRTFLTRRFQLSPGALGPKELCCLFVDISERKRAEEERAERAAIVDSVSDAIIASTVGGRVTAWNRGAERLFGYRELEMLGQPVSVLSREDRVRELEERLAIARAGNAVGPVEELLEDREGRPVEVSLTISPIRERSGHVIGLAFVSRDIGPQKATERLRQDLLAMLSHDLRSPLGAAVAYTELLRRTPPDSPKRDRYLDEIQGAAQLALNLAMNFVDSARLQAGAFEPELDLAAIGEVVGEVAGNLRSVARLREVELHIEHSAEVPRVFLDRGLIQRAVMNLVDNALRKTPKGGRVSLSTDLAPGGVELRVRDTGTGVPEALRERIFERYESGGGGSGLGLFIVRTIVEAHRGSVRLESPREGGAEFVLTLPLPQND